jgi:putative FmdB family regulatory protein
VPIYEYECKKCGHLKEAWQNFSEPPLTECEVCHGKLRKLISNSTFHLKGTGWYVTDYASKSGGSQGGDTKSEKDSSAASKESKETSKPDSSKKKGSADTSKKAVSSTK